MIAEYVTIAKEDNYLGFKCQECRHCFEIYMSAAFFYDASKVIMDFDSGVPIFMGAEELPSKYKQCGHELLVCPLCKRRTGIEICATAQPSKNEIATELSWNIYPVLQEDKRVAACPHCARVSDEELGSSHQCGSGKDNSILFAEIGFRYEEEG